MSTVTDDGVNWNKINTALVSIIAKEDICHYVLQVSEGSSKKDGFTSKVSSIKVIGQKKDQEEMILNLILKSLPNNKDYNDFFSISELFELEVLMYSKILPEYKLLLMENNLPSMDIYPKLYYASEDAIILENIKSKGFQLCENLRDQDHLELAILEVGRLHAASFALKISKQETFDDLAPRNTLFSDLYSKILRKSIGFLSKRSLKMLDPLTDGEAITKFFPYSQNIDLYFDSMQELSNEEYSIIIHGDMWSSNMMFNYEDSDRPKKPTKVCFFDFQTIALGPPVIDLIDLIYVNGSAQVYDALDHYQALYYESLTEHLKRFHLNSSNVYPFSVLKEQWKTFAKFSLILNQVIAQLKSLDEKNLPNSDNSDTMRLEDLELLTFAKDPNEEAYKSCVRPLILHLAERDFL